MMTTVAVIAACALGATEDARIMEFTSRGCGPCRQMATIVERLNQLGCAIQQVDVDQRPDLAETFGVSQIPCFVIVQDGRVVDRWIGTASYDELLGFCQRANSEPVIRGQTASQPRRTIIDQLRQQGAQAQPPVVGMPAAMGHTAGTAAGQQGLVGAAEIVTDPSRPSAFVYPDFSTEVPPSGPNSPESSQIASQTSVPDSRRAAGSGDELAATVASGTNPIDRALWASVRLRVEDEQGHSFGTGTVVDVHDQEALILTCGHIFRSSGGRGRIFCDFQGAEGTSVAGTLISYDIRRDVGLISARPRTPIEPVRVGGGGRQPRQGDAVFSVGCNHGDAPTIIQNRILAVNRYHGPANLVVGGRPVDGRSGGGLFAADGTLIGVCNAADEQHDEGVYAALGPIHAELDRAGLGFVYQPREASDTGPQVAGQGDIVPSSFAADEADASGRAFPEPASAIPTRMPSTAPLNTGMGAPGASVELICILRSCRDGVDRSRVVVIDRPSSELVSRLSQEVNQRGPHADTNMHVPSLTPPNASREPHIGPQREGDWRGQ